MAQQPTTGNDWEGQLIDYMLGSMESTEAAQFGQRLDECRQHVVLASQYSQAIGWLGVTAPPAEPPDGHKARLIARIAGTSQQPSLEAESAPIVVVPDLPQPRRPPARAEVVDLGAYRERKSAPWPAFTAVAAVLALLVGLWGWSNLQARNDLEARVNALQNQLNDTQQRLAQVESSPNVPPSYVPVIVAGEGPQENAQVISFVNAATNEVVLVARNLQPIPADRDFELWWLPETGPPVAAGVFSSDPTGSARHQAIAPQSLSNYKAIAVTVEKKGGVPAPEGPIVMVGNLQ